MQGWETLDRKEGITENVMRPVEPVSNGDKEKDEGSWDSLPAQSGAQEGLVTGAGRLAQVGDQAQRQAQQRMNEVLVQEGVARLAADVRDDAVVSAQISPPQPPHIQRQLGREPLPALRQPQQPQLLRYEATLLIWDWHMTKVSAHLLSAAGLL